MTARRKGPGRWCAVRKPAGVLWESATGIGFLPTPGTDGSSVESRLGEGFDALAAELGEQVQVSSELSNWRPA